VSAVSPTKSISNELYVEVMALPLAVVVPVTVIVPDENSGAPGAAFAGTAENPAIANADAATSAMRLKLVFVDIIFLSRKVDSGNFPLSAWSEIAFS
jgi:hypothetical protein